MKKCISIFLVLNLMLTTALTAFSESGSEMDKVIKATASYIYETVKEPQVGSIGGEWAILGLSRSGIEIPDEYYEGYYNRVEEYVRAHNGILHDKKYTEYSRVITALTSIGKNPQEVSGYNLLTPLGDYEKTIWQGINGPVWALIALDSGNYVMPQNPSATVQATREMYIERILACQLEDGGWSLLCKQGEASDVDITGMVLQALSKYRDDERVNRAINTALGSMSKKQDDKGGFSSDGTENAESCAQMLVALCELGISVDDSRFVKNGLSIIDSLMSYYNNGKGFKHILNGTESNLMATEQAFYGLVAVKRAMDGKSSLYTMTDALSLKEKTEAVQGLKNKNPDVKKSRITAEGKTFSDIVGHENKFEIEALAERGIINGKTENSFEPSTTMTRAEFATIIVRGLQLPQKGNDIFKDVSENEWFYSYVNTAFSYGIINGVSETEFNPDGTISREEATVMIARAAKLCGLETDMDMNSVRNVLAQFTDYVKASAWAQSSLAFCFDSGILSDEALEIEPKESVTRAEIASMLYRMFYISKLL